MTLYLVRHAQSMPTKSQFFSEWPLSPAGAHQAEQLADLLKPLGITHVFSSPFVRSVHTAKPFAQQQELQITLLDDLRERLITKVGPPTDDIWHKGWADFNFCPEGCETSLTAQTRIRRAVTEIAGNAKGVTAVFTHGNVIGLFLNALTASFGRKETEALKNPDVLKMDWQDGVFTWDQDFQLKGLANLATAHGQTPQEQEPSGTSRNPLPVIK